MYSDYWLKSGYQYGESIKVLTVADYKIWIDNRGCIVGVTVDFEEADDYYYDLPIVNGLNSSQRFWRTLT